MAQSIHSAHCLLRMVNLLFLIVGVKVLMGAEFCLGRYGSCL